MITNPLINNPEVQAADPVTYTNNVLSTVFSIFFIVAIIYFVWNVIMAGYHLISNDNGDTKKMQEAKNAISYSLVGLVVIFCVFAILKFVGTVLGIPDLGNLRITLPTL